MEGASSLQSKKVKQVVDGSDIMKLVGNDKVFGDFVDHKFKELDNDSDGHLSVSELQPAVADIGAALGLPAHGSSPDSDHIYSELLQEFTHGKQEKVSKTEFKEVLSDILIGMATGLKRDPIVLLRLDGHDLLEFINGPSYEAEMVPIFTEIDSSDAQVSDHIINALGKLTVNHGVPPTSDPWVMSNIVEPAIESCKVNEHGQMSEEKLFAEFRRVVEHIAQHLKEQPVIVAHSENSFDGSGIRRLLSNKFELDKTVDAAMENIPREGHGKINCKEHLLVVLDSVAPYAGLPPLGAIQEMDKIVEEAVGMMNGKMVKAEELKKMIIQVLGSVMLQLEGNPVLVSTNSVVHEPLVSSSSLLHPPSTTTTNNNNNTNN